MCNLTHVSTFKLLLSSFRVLLRVRMLYYLKQEVIGEHADSVLKGADIRYAKTARCEEKTKKNQLHYTH